MDIVDIADRLDWTYISQFQTLSEPFIIKHERDVRWDMILKYQTVSAELWKKHGTQKFYNPPDDYIMDTMLQSAT